MGAECCRDQTVKRDLFNKLQTQIMTPISNKEYYIHDWPIDQQLQSKIDELNQSEEFREVFTNHKMMKHKFYDKYYVGEWNAEGFPDGKGVLLVPDYFLYFGEFNKMPHGKGVVELFREKIRYKGQLKNGKAEGEGKISSSDGRYSFEGEMEDSNPKTGQIIIHNAHDEHKSYKIVINNFPRDKSEIHYGDGRKYCGFLDKKTFAPQGDGTAVFPDDSRYEGQWEDGEMHGKGFFSWVDGSSYRGEYQHGRKHGMGRFMFSSGKYYEGEWVHGRQNGKGSLFQKHGQQIHRGLWKEGVFISAME